jgi:hypothetical protein
MNELSRSIATETHLHSLAAADGHRREITPANLEAFGAFEPGAAMIAEPSERRGHWPLRSAGESTWTS